MSKFKPLDRITDYVAQLTDTEGLTNFLMKRAEGALRIQQKRVIVLGLLGLAGVGLGLFVGGVPVVKWLFPAAGMAIGVVAADAYYRFSGQYSLFNKITDPFANVTKEEYMEAGVTFQ